VVEVWTDGSGTTAQTPGGWAYVLRYVDPITGGMIEKEGFGGSFEGSNNQMELSAALYGLRALRKSCKVIVHSDSKYVVNPFNRGWIDAWRNRNWTKLKNLDLWLALIEEADRHETTFKWVPRRGHPGNERADKLAGQARRAIDKAREDGTVTELGFVPTGAARRPSSPSA
jgi:ribonuclease HI